MTRRELKNAAKDQLRGNWLWAVALSFVASLIIYIVGDLLLLVFNHSHEMIYYVSRTWASATEVSGPTAWTDVIEFFFTIFAGLLIWGVTYTLLQFRDSGDQPNIFKGIFSAYTSQTFTSSFVTFLVYYLFLYLWTLLFIIPGIIKSFSYAMTPYIMKDYYDAGKYPITSTEAITASRKLMDGHKWELFVLYLSFLGWILLGIITMGIGFLWITPYIRQTIANYYRDLAGDQFITVNED